jgi:hypothetical protein
MFDVLVTIQSVVEDLLVSRALTELGHDPEVVRAAIARVRADHYITDRAALRAAVCERLVHDDA